MAKKVDAIDPRDLAVGVAIEMREHPNMGKRLATKTAAQHLQKDRNAYADQGNQGRVVVVLNQNVKAIPAKKRKRAATQQAQMVDDKPAWIPNSLRRPF